MIPLTNHNSQWGRSEVVIIYPDLLVLLLIASFFMCLFPKRHDWFSMSFPGPRTHSRVEGCAHNNREKHPRPGLEKRSETMGKLGKGDERLGKIGENIGKSWGKVMKGWGSNLKNHWDLSDLYWFIWIFDVTGADWRLFLWHMSGMIQAKRTVWRAGFQLAPHQNQPQCYLKGSNVWPYILRVRMELFWKPGLYASSSC